MTLSDPDRPTPLRCRPSHRNIATQVHQNPATDHRGRPIGSPISAARLGRRPQINHHTGWDGKRPTSPVDPDALPTRNGPKLQRHRGPIRRNLPEIPVIAGDDQSRTNRRGDQAIGHPGRTQSVFDGSEQQAGNGHSPPGGVVRPAQLTVRPETARRRIKSRDFAPNHLDRGIKHRLSGGHHGDPRTNCRKADRRKGQIHDAPDVVAAAFPVDTGADTLDAGAPPANPDEVSEDPEVVEERPEPCEEPDWPDDDRCVLEAATEPVAAATSDACELAPEDATQENKPAKAKPPAATPDVNQRTRRCTRVRP